MKRDPFAKKLLASVLPTGICFAICAGVALAQPPGGPPPSGTPPSGTPMGGMMMMGGGAWGGGGGGGGGGWGGDRGGDRGRGSWGGGGFDPSQFITRMDTNGNGSLDPEEVQGPARFMLERMARNNPKIDMSKPIPIAVLTESIQQMRGGSSGGSGGSWGGSWGGFGAEDESVDAPSSTLVPGFGIKLERQPVPGFGSAGALSTIQVDERDRRDADERMRRYDKNNDGSLDGDEVKEARWSDSIAQWDRNRDGKLSRDEVAVRYARRREQRQDQEARGRGGEENRGRQQTADNDKKEPSRPFEKTASFRIGGVSNGTARPAGLPEWFVRDDADGDNQVAMNEFARKWDASTLEEFSKFDVNGDGYITAKECLAGVKKGYLKGSSSSSSSSVASSSTSKEPAPATPGPTPSSGPTRANTPASNSGGVDPAMIDWSRKNLAKKDKDKNGFLTPDEFSDSSAKFGDIDTDGNGQINVEEYAAFRQNRSKK
jgi:hypothetical protein